MPTPTTNSPTTGLQTPFTQKGANLEWIIEPSTGDGKMLAFQKGDAFPRFVIDFAAGDILKGDGASPPVSVLGGGGGGNPLGLPVFNVVTQYHADRSGATDAASPINQAISDAHAAGGGIVWVPIGTYSVASADIVMLSGVRLWGENATGAVLVDNRASGSTIRLRGATAGTPIERCSVEHLNITGTNPGTNSRIGIELTYAQRCTVEQNEITNSGYGVRAYGTTSTTITQNRLVSCGSADASGKGALHVVDDASGHCEHVVIERNVCSGCFEHDIAVVGVGSNRPEDITVRDNQLLGAHVRGNRVDLRVTKACRVVSNRISMSAYDSGYSTVVDGVYLRDAQGATVSDNEFVLSAAVASACVDVDATTVSSTDVTIQGNKLSATALLTTAMVLWRNSAPAYNLRGTSLDNGIISDTSGNVLRVGNPNTLTPTHTYGPLNAKEYGAIGDGTAFDGPALVAWIAAVLATGRQGYLPQGTYLCQSDASTPTLLVIDKGTGASGQSIFRGDGDTSALIQWKVKLGLDIYGNPNVGWKPLRCGVSQAVDLHGIGFVGAVSSTTATINPNSAPITPDYGYLVEIGNRCVYEHFSARRGYVGVLVDGQIGSGQFQAATKVDGANTITVDSRFCPQPPSTVIGMTIAGSGIPSGSLVTAVSGYTITLDHNVNNGAGTQPLDVAVYPVGSLGSSRVQNTDHHSMHEVLISNCRYGMYVRRNSGTQGGGNTGTKDFTYRRLSIGQCQWAGIAASEDGYWQDCTWDFIHVANTAYGWYKEGHDGILQSQPIFMSDAWYARCKNEGAGNFVFYDESGLSLCDDWAGFFEFDGGVEINGQKTHKFLSPTLNDHTSKPYSGSATRDAAGRITVTVADSSVVHVGDPIATESQNAVIGGNGGDASFVDCAMVETIPDGTHFTALVGAQTKTMTPAAYALGATSITITGNPNIKTQDIGNVVTGFGIPAGTYADNTNFNTQTFVLVDAAGNPVATTAAWDGTTKITFTLPVQATPVNLRFGKIGGMRLGDISNWNCTFNVNGDPTADNVAAQNYVSFNTMQLCRFHIVSDNSEVFDVDIRAGLTLTKIDSRMVRGDQEYIICQANGDITIGTPLRFVTTGKVQAVANADFSGGGVFQKPYAGIARRGAHASGPTVGLSLSAASGLDPFVVASRTWLPVQIRGSNYSQAIVDGGGVNVVDGVVQNASLVLSSTTPGRCSAWDGAAQQKLVVAISAAPAAGVAGSQKCDAELVAPYFT